MQRFTGGSSPLLPVHRTTSSSGRRQYDDAKGLKKKRHLWFSLFRIFAIVFVASIFLGLYVWRSVATFRRNRGAAGKKAEPTAAAQAAAGSFQDKAEPAVVGPSNSSARDPLWDKRRDAVASAFDHAWKGYETYAFGYDELAPVSKRGTSWLNMGLTIFDSLDTAYIMGNKKAFNSALQWVRNDFQMVADVNANVFETTIRVLGGLLTAYHLSGEEILKTRAIEVAEKFMPAFQTGSKLPLSSIHLKSGKAVPSASDVSTAEATTIQLEFKYLTHITGDPKYWNAVEDVMILMDELKKQDGLVPIFMNSHTGTFRSSEIRLGSRGDSYYEYLGKQYILTNKTEPGHHRQYQEALQGIKKHLLMRSIPHNLLYVRELPGGLNSPPTDKMDHLVCFLPGTIALMATDGKRITSEERAKLSEDQREDLYVAEELTRSCYEMYHQTVTGLAPEIVYFKPGAGKGGLGAIKPAHDGDDLPRATDVPDGLIEEDISINPSDGHNLLRPETIESIFYMYRITGDVKYREWGWKMFESFEKFTKVETGGYSSLVDVRRSPPQMRDKMESFFLGETLKYFYLLFSDESVIPLDRYVFNTEAHPLPIFEPNETVKRKLRVVSAEQPAQH